MKQMIQKTSDMKLLQVKHAKTTYPTGKKTFAVLQSFPAAFDELETDPFLMCDEFGPTPSLGRSSSPDDFPVGWHPHRGMDIMTYLRKGTGRHADSLGNRGTFASPGLQWISTGSGIEHAEGGGTEAGEIDHGFQIWVNVPREHKMDDPRYGTEPPENIPIVTQDGVLMRVLAGGVNDVQGPFKTVQPVQIIDLTLSPNSAYSHSVPTQLNTCIVYIYEGKGSIADTPVSRGQVVKLDASQIQARDVSFACGPDGLGALIFSGQRLDEPISWQGPFVMNTREEIEQTIREYQTGKFLRKRSPWNYKKWSDFPIETREKENL